MSRGFLHTWQLAITPLSPLHIGTGEDYEPTQYVIDGERLFGFSPAAALRALPGAPREDLLRILGGPPDVALIKAVQGYFYRHRERLIPEAEYVIPVLPSIAAEYAARVGKTAQQERDRDIINQLRIGQTFGNPATRRPILPGSSLKGAIRTALLDEVNDGSGLREVEDRRTGRMRKENNQELQQRLFHYKAGQFHLDPMRLVQLGDAADRRPAATIGTEIRYAVNRKRHEVLKGGQEVRSQAENLRQVLECVPPLRPRAFHGSLALQDPGDLSGPKLPDPDLRWSLADLAGACNAFYRPILERELADLRSRGFLDTDWAATVEQILAQHEPALSANRAFLLRMGFHSGAESVTLNGVRDIKINMGRDPQTGKTRYEYHPFTKTIWLAARDIQDRRDLLPFGWVLVETVPTGQTLADWPDTLTAAALPAALDEAEWIVSAQARQTELRARLAEQQLREQAQQEAAEQARREEEQQTARLASLSAEARQIETLRGLLDRDRRANLKQPGGELSNTLAELLKVAQDTWPPAECAALADLAEEVYRFMGWPAKKKKEERQSQIQALRLRATT
jgi:CRISPR-associated protein Csm5